MQTIQKRSERNMNNKLEVIGIDHGWSMMKTISQVFVTGVKEITTTPALFGDVLEYEGKFYKVGTVRQEVKDTKVEDDSFYLLTLAAVENSFIVNNINIVQGKEKIFVSMPSYKTKQVDEQGKPIYQDVCYPVTKDFRERLYNEIISEYEKAKDKSNEKARESAEKHHGNPDKEKDKEATPFR